MTGQTPYYISRKQAKKFQEKFHASLENAKHSPLLFQIYGFGGVGKTTMTRRLEEIYKEKVDFAKVSFGLTADIQTPLKLMVKLYEQLPKTSSLNPFTKLDPFISLYEEYENVIYKLKTEPLSDDSSVDTEQESTVKDCLELGSTQH